MAEGNKPSTRDLLLEKITEREAELTPEDMAPAAEPTEVKVESAPVEKAPVKETKVGRPPKEGIRISDLKATKPEQLVRGKAPDAANEVKEQPPQIGAPEAKADEPILNPIIPPQGWNKEEKDYFKTLPRKTQEILTRYNKEIVRGMNEKFQDMSRVMAQHEGIDKILSKYQQSAALRGRRIEDGLDTILAWDDFLQKNPAEAAAQMIAAYKIDPRQIMSRLGVQAQGGQPQHQQPQTQQFQIPDELRQELDDLRSWKSQMQQDFEAGQRRVLDDTIVSWRDEKDEDGNPLRPYLEELAPVLMEKADMLQRGNPKANPLDILNDAYDLALKANPEIQDAIRQSKEARSKAKQLEQSAAAATRAEKAAASIRGGGGGPMAPAKMSQKEMLSGLLSGRLT